MRLIILMMAAMMLWGGGWPALKIVTESVGVEVVTFWRFVIMAVAFIPILFWYRRPLKRSVSSWKIGLTAGALNIAFMVSSFYGVAMGTAGAGGVIITILSPVMTVLLGIWLLGLRVTGRQWSGLALGIFGGVVMIEVWSLDALQGGNLFFVLSALIWGFLTILSQRSQHHLDPLHYSFMLALSATVLLSPVVLFYDVGIVFEQDLRFWAALLYLGILGQTVASTIFFIASVRLGSDAASFYMFLVPLSALGFSYLVLGEIPSIWLVAGGIISTMAVYRINRVKKASIR